MNMTGIEYKTATLRVVVGSSILASQSHYALEWLELSLTILLLENYNIVSEILKANLVVFLFFGSFMIFF